MDFKYGDLIIKCHQCGGEELVEESITDGRAIYLFNTHDNYIKLHCPVCNITMEMSIVPSKNAPEEDVIETETIIESNEELPKEVTAEETV